MRVYRTKSEPDPQVIMMLADKDEHIEELEIAIRAALSFVQDRYSQNGTYNDGHAQMVEMALRGALAKRERD